MVRGIGNHQGIGVEGDAPQRGAGDSRLPVESPRLPGTAFAKNAEPVDSRAIRVRKLAGFEASQDAGCRGERNDTRDRRAPRTHELLGFAHWMMHMCPALYRRC